MPACFSQVLTAQVNGENSIVPALTLSVVSDAVFLVALGFETSENVIYVGANPSADLVSGIDAETIQE